ncbi:MAG: hypothetical protein HQ485_16005 [Acidobacteria bacterium]|jgi:hypothetical protein|nr:hypothetical protein [Acidobacteriota bacterium]
MTPTRALPSLVIVSLLLVPYTSTNLAQGTASYATVAALPDVVDGQPLRDFAFDEVARRVYAASDRGLFWSDLNDARPAMKGPLFKKDLLRIEMAPDLGRLFYFTNNEIGYVDLRGASPTPVTLAVGRDWATELVYEPVRQEIYVATRTPKVLVFDARSGERGAEVKVPGWWATSLEAVPGHVFMNVSNKNGLYEIDAATHVAKPWPIDGKLVTPAYLESDPSGRNLFAVYDQFIVAIDVATAKVVGRVTTTAPPVVAFDPGTGLLVASWANASRRNLILKAFRVDDSGLTEVAEMSNPSRGLLGLEPTSGGFLQKGSHSLLVWSTGQVSDIAGQSRARWSGWD